MNLAKFALRNPITVLMAVLGSIILGVISFSKLPVDMFPDITFPSITVATFYPGANPQDMERMVTYPVEKAVSTVNGVKYVSSISRQGASLVTIYFNWGTNLDSAQSDVLQAVNLIHGDLPKDVQYPIIRKFDVSQISVIFIALMGGGLDEGQLYDLAYNVVEPEIEHVRNVASARVVTKLGNVEKAYVTGDFARGMDAQIIDLIFVGAEINQEYLVRLVNKTEDLIRRKIRYVIFHPEEFENYRKTRSGKDMLLIWKREE